MSDKSSAGSTPREGEAGRTGSPTSRSLLLKARARDEDAWRRLLRLYSPLVEFWCRQMHVPAQDIGDVCQGVFQAAAANIATFRSDGAGCSFRGWLRTITRTKAIDYHRAQSRQPAAAGGSTAQHLLSQLPECLEEDSQCGSHQPPPLRAAVLQAALDYIRGEFRQQTWAAFWMVAVEGRSPAEAASELSMTAGAVRVAKCRVLARLRAELEDLAPESEA